MNDINNLQNNYVLICNNERVEELNERILARNYPSSTLEPQFQSRSQPTRYVHFKTIDNNQCVITNKTEPYCIRKTFNPGTRNAPWSGYVNNIDEESRLRCQLVPLQNEDYLAYIPKDTSDLYVNKFKPSYNIEEQGDLANSQLFDKPNLSVSQNVEEASCNLTTKIFNNDTRQQLKNS